MSTTIDIPETAVAVCEPQAIAPSGLFGASEPVQVIERATTVATALRAVIAKQGLISDIKGKQYPKCEAWTLLGTMLGVFPVLCWSRPVDGGWEARVEARTRDGGIVGAAEAQCLRAERNWKDRDDFALRSMAQTRATAKCLRMPLGFVMTLAGYEPTPAEEMTHEMENRPQTGRTPPQAPQGKKPPLPPQNAPETKPAPNSPVYATDKTRAWMLRELSDCLDLATEYFQKLDNGGLLPSEPLASLPLRFVPINREQLAKLKERIADFGNGGEAIPAYFPNPEPPAEKKPRVGKPAGVPKGDDEWWRDVIVPVPHKGETRAEYLKHPETIGQLFDMRHGTNDECAEARRRLFGFVQNYQPKGWTKKDGTEMPPSESDLKFRDALDSFQDWFEKNHPDEKL